MKQILIYTDEGTGPRSVRLLIKSLQIEHVLQNHALKRINRTFFEQPGWEEACSLLVFPGGRDLFYHTALTGTCHL